MGGVGEVEGMASFLSQMSDRLPKETGIARRRENQHVLWCSSSTSEKGKGCRDSADSLRLCTEKCGRSPRAERWGSVKTAPYLAAVGEQQEEASSLVLGEGGGEGRNRGRRGTCRKAAKESDCGEAGRGDDSNTICSQREEGLESASKHGTNALDRRSGPGQGLIAERGAVKKEAGVASVTGRRPSRR